MHLLSPDYILSQLSSLLLNFLDALDLFQVSLHIGG
jgi:hypothetical protein